MTVTVLGASGRLGRMVSRPDHANDGDAVALRLQTTQAPCADMPGDWFSWRHGTGTADRAALARHLEGSDAVLNLAGVTPHDRQPESDALYHRLNVELADTVFEAAAEAGVRTVFLASSAAVYGRPEPGETLLSENRAARPLSAYGRSKAEMEARALARTGGAVRPCILRLGNIAGADALLGNAMRGAGGGVTLDAFASGAGPLRSYIGPQDLRDVLLALLLRAGTAPQTLPDILNVAHPAPVRMDALLRALERARAGLFTWATRPASAAVIERVVLDTARLCALYAFPNRPDPAAALIAQALDSVEAA